MDTGKIVAVLLSSLLLFSAVAVAAGDEGLTAQAAANHESASVDSVTLEDTEITVGETAEVEVTARNPGVVGEWLPVTLEVDGEGVTTKTVRVSGGSSTNVEFEERFDTAGTYEISANGINGGQLTVVAENNGPELAIVSSSTYDEQIRVGESLTVYTTVENVGDEFGEFTVDLTGSGSTFDTLDVGLGAGESQFSSLDFAPEEPGTYDLALESDDDDSNAGTVEVQGEPEPAFEVSDATISDSQILLGQTVTVTATVENVGDASGSYTASLRVDGSSVDSRTVSLQPGESTEVTFDHQFQNQGTYSVAVDDATAGTVSVELPPDVSVTAADVRAETASVGEQVTIEATVQNTGDVEGDAALDLVIDGTVVDSLDVTVPGQESKTVEFSHQFDDPGTRQVAVNDVTAGDVSVLRPASFEVSDATMDSTEIEAGNPVAITATVENTGDETGTYDAELTVDGEVVNSTAVTVEGGSSEQVSFERVFDEPGAYDIAIGGTEVGTLDVLAPAQIGIVDTETRPQTATVGNRVRVRTTVENTGDISDDITLELTADGTALDSETVEVPSGETATINLSHTFESAGERGLSVNGEPAGAVTVQAPAAFELDDIEVSQTTVTAGETVTVTAMVENTGGVNGTVRPRLVVGGEPVADRILDLDGGQSEQVAFRHTFEEAGDYSVSVSDEVAGRVTVESPATMQVAATALSTTRLLTNETLQIRARIDNTGDRDGTATVPVAIDGTTVAEPTLSIRAGDNRAFDVEYQFEEPGTYEVSVADTTAGTVAVEEPAAVEITRTDVNQTTVPTERPVGVTATVANVGDREGTVAVELAIDGEVVAVQTVTMGAQDNETVEFAESFTETGEYDIAVENATVGTVTVEQTPGLEVEDAAVLADRAAEGHATAVQVTVENPGNWTQTERINVTADDTVVASQRVTLEPGEQRAVQMEFEATNGTIAVEGVEAGALSEPTTVETGQNTNDDGGGWLFQPVTILLVLLTAAAIAWIGLSISGVLNRDHDPRRP